MMTEEVKKELDQEVMTDFHEQLLSKCVSLVQLSRDVVQNNYLKWDERQKVYDAERDMDTKDRKAKADNEPAKMVLPLSTAQVNTFIAACVSLLRQKPRFFEFDPSGAEDFDLREPSEMLLEKDLSANKFSVLLHQFFLDLARFGIGVFKHQWAEEKLRVLLPQTTQIFDDEVAAGQEYQEVTTFVGNRIDSISPYKFYPDVRMPLTRFQEGEFCASENEFTKIKLKRLEADGEVAGIKHIQPFSANQLHRRSQNSDNHRFVSINKQNPSIDYENFCLTECQVWLVPKEFELNDGGMLGKEDFPVLYLVSYVNDSRIIKVEPMNNYHSGFTYEVAQLSPDQHKRMSKSISDMVGPLQELIDWYLNARVEAVKRTLENNLVVNPRFVDMKSLSNRDPVIKLTRDTGQGGIDRYVKHLPVADNTAHHFEDIGRLSAIMDQTTGINDPSKGQAQTGRRSATEMRGVIQGGAMRIVHYCLLAWEQAIAPMGSKMLTNHRQNISFDYYKGVVGDTADEEVFTRFKANATSLIGKTDLFIFDGVLPSEKDFMAQSLQELLIVILQSPELAIQFGFNPMKMIKEIYELRGITGLERFRNTPEEQQEAQAQQLQQLLLQANGTTNGQPQASVRV